jgi:nitrite transporter NirC
LFPALCLLAALYFPLPGVDPAPSRPHPVIGILELMAGMPFHAFFGIAVVMSTGLIAPFFAHPPAAWGISELSDQASAGAIAWAFAEIPTLIMLLAMAARWRRSEQRSASRADRAADRDRGAELAAYNAYLARPRRAAEPAGAPAPGFNRLARFLSNSRPPKGARASADTPAVPAGHLPVVRGDCTVKETRRATSAIPHTPKDGIMPIPVSEALSEQGRAAAAKVVDLRSPGRYLVSSMLAGAYIGVAVVLLFSVTGPLLAEASPFTKLIQGLVFGVALTLVVFAGAELSTGNMMTGVQGVLTGQAGVGGAVAVILGSFVGNLAGSVAFAWLVHASGVLSAGAAPGHVAPGIAILTSVVKAKAVESGSALFFRGVLCNFLVCLAVWMSARTKSDGAKLALIFWCLLAFVASGFEHVVANMTVFSLGMFEHVKQATLGAFAGNLLLVGLGNLVGGGLLVGASYGLLGRQTAEPAAAPATAEQEAAVPA